MPVNGSNSIYPLLLPVVFISKFSFTMPVKQKNNLLVLSPSFLAITVLFHVLNEVRDINFVYQKIARTYINQQKGVDGYRLLNTIGDVCYNLYMFAIMHAVCYGYGSKAIVRMYVDFQFAFSRIPICQWKLTLITTAIYLVTFNLCGIYYVFRIYDSYTYGKRERKRTFIPATLMAAIAGGSQLSMELQIWAYSFLLACLFYHFNRNLQTESVKETLTPKNVDALRVVVVRLFDLSEALDSYFGVCLLFFMVNRSVYVQFYSFKGVNFLYHVVNGSREDAVDEHITVTCRNLAIQIARILLIISTFNIVVREVKFIFHFDPSNCLHYALRAGGKRVLRRLDAIMARSPHKLLEVLHLTLVAGKLLGVLPVSYNATLSQIHSSRAWFAYTMAFHSFFYAHDTLLLMSNLKKYFFHDTTVTEVLETVVAIFNCAYDNGVTNAGVLFSIFVSVIWILLNLILLIVIVHLCANTEFEAKKTGPLLSKIANSLPESPTRESLLWFASEVSSRKVKFTACGLFPINYELLFAAAGSCATNMAILMQAHIVTLKQKEQ
ncbi:Hypothetical predicted protein [Cloeon dipterum]|uniref:Gustatory receptor n=1 Tax=Cloeon dipterum TaxID=197152 RepID=A0A8S1CTW6_9INSE|nr:Hypothetical predicted protein [Cloeon dipterum]